MRLRSSSLFLAKNAAASKALFVNVTEGGEVDEADVVDVEGDEEDMTGGVCTE